MSRAVPDPRSYAEEIAAGRLLATDADRLQSLLDDVIDAASSRGAAEERGAAVDPYLDAETAAVGALRAFVVAALAARG